jgi:hypothetical protein
MGILHGAPPGLSQSLEDAFVRGSERDRYALRNVVT